MDKSIHGKRTVQLGQSVPTPVTIRIWNNLPSDVVMSPSLEVFKSRLTGAMVMQKTD